MNRSKTLTAVLGVVATALAAAVFASPTLASHLGTYCVDGTTTDYGHDPTTSITASSVSAGSHTEFVTLGIATVILGNGWSTFYLGYDGSNWQFAGSPAGLEAGYTAHTLTSGACVSSAAAAPAITHVAVCKLLPRGDGTTGLFQEITVADWNDKDRQYFDAPAANWVEGLGLTCDNPVALGYKPAGYNVAWGGKPDPANDPGGVRASGLNNIYPYFVK